MDRILVYPGAIPQDTDLLSTNRNAMIALGYLLQGVFGTTTAALGLACNPTSPASLQVTVGDGAIVALEEIDPSAYGSLPLSTQPLVKMGINYGGATTETLAAPGTAGYSINYLIEAQFLEQDVNATVLPYYNAANPSLPYSGPANSGTAQNTLRQEIVSLQVKAGTAATTGTQTTPAVDSGWVGLWVVTVANGQTQINSGNIAPYPGAPFLPFTLPGVQANFTGLIGSASKAKMSVVTASATATFNADEVVVGTALGSNSWKLANYSQSINLATTGAGGMDTGTAPVSGFVALYAIYNPTTATASILATNASSAAQPTIYSGGHMPSGYTASGLISVWPTNGSSQLVAGFQHNRRLSLAQAAVITTGTVVSVTALSLGALAPLNAVSVLGNLIASSTSTSNGALSVHATTGGFGAQVLEFGVAAGEATSAPFQVDVSSPGYIYYALANTGGTPTATIYVSGYEI